MSSRKGFTLLELIIVVIVIGILASIALPRYIRIAEKGRVAEAKSILSAIRGAQMRYGSQYGNWSTSIPALDVSMQSKYFTYAAAAVSASAGIETAVVATATRNMSVEPPAGYPVYSISITGEGTMTISNASLSFLL